MSHPEPCICGNPGNANAPMIVLTGGPGAGKTAVLELVKKELCSNIAVLPEAAGVIFGGGFWRHDTVVGKKAAQRAIFHVQREAERLAREEGDYSLILCDRGTVDGVAYWPESAETYWREIGTTKEDEFSRYSAVIHLHTPSLHMGYNRSNPIRIETASQAAEIDKRIVEAWAGHPNRHFINNSHDFLEKAMRAIAIIREALPYQCTKTLIATEPA